MTEPLIDKVYDSVRKAAMEQFLSGKTVPHRLRVVTVAALNAVADDVDGIARALGTEHGCYNAASLVLYTEPCFGCKNQAVTVAQYIRWGGVSDG